jgi:hypothetical protein
MHDASHCAFFGVNAKATPYTIEADFLELMLKTFSRGTKDNKIISIGRACLGGRVRMRGKR